MSALHSQRPQQKSQNPFLRIEPLREPPSNLSLEHTTPQTLFVDENLLGSFSYEAV
jgi:hypothetical protein